MSILLVKINLSKTPETEIRWIGLTEDMGLTLMSTTLPIQNVRHHTYPAWSGLTHSLVHYFKRTTLVLPAPLREYFGDTVESFCSYKYICCTSSYNK